ncbi:MAG: hypothetical protein IMZ69_10110 [Spirochaetes bacterium]|nr:hypothetical protein [Spirochaetota bacterium]
MSITREELYQQVWAEPMIKVAARYEVCSNYLAKVCEYLNVPRPPRGFWAKLSVGKAPERPPLPTARPGEVLEWAKGDAVPHPLRSLSSVDAKRSDAAAKPWSARRQDRHELVAGVREFFEAGRLSEVGYLRPLKRNLVDVFVSKPVLTYALDTANELFQSLEKRGHRVALAPAGEFQRPELTVYQGQKFDYYNSEPWHPGRKTVVYIGAVALGLTVYESTEEVEVTYEWNRPVRYVRVSESPPKRRPKWMGAEPSIKRHMPSGRLAVRAYSPYGPVSWEERWLEDKVGGLSGKIGTVVRELESVVATIVQRREEAQRQAEIERQRWEAECRERERREQERRRAQAVKESREQLFAIVDAWALADRIERFFDDAERRASALGSDDRAGLLDRIRQARTLLGGTDALVRLQQWKAPSER